MPFTLKIIFAGMIAFAPEMDKNEMMVILVDSGTGHHMLEHLPRLEVGCATLVDTTMQSQCFAGTNGWEKSELVRLFKAISIKDRDILVEINGSVPSTDELAIGEGFSAVPVMSKIIKQSPVLADSYFKRPLDVSLHGLIDGRVRLTKGSVDILEIRQGVWEFRTKNGFLTHSQEAASTVEYVIQNVNSIKFLVSKYDGSGLQEIKLSPEGQNRELIVWVTNEPRKEEYCDSKPSATFLDFGRYYEFAGLNGSLDRPIPRSYEVDYECGCNTEKYGCGRQPIICMDTQFETSDLPAW